MGTELKSRTASSFLMFLVFWEALTRSFVKFRGRPSASLRVPTREAGFLLNVRAAGDDTRSNVMRTKRCGAGRGETAETTKKRKRIKVTY